MACARMKIECSPDSMCLPQPSDQSPSRIGLSVLDICRLADIVFWAFTGRTARTAASRQR